MMQRIKTIVCGSTFGQYYIDALKKYDEFFEVIGLLALGEADDLLHWQRKMEFLFLRILTKFQKILSWHVW